MTEVAELRARLDACERRFRMVIGAAPDGIAMVEPTGELGYGNPAFTAMFDVTFNDISPSHTGTPPPATDVYIRDLVDARDRDRFEQVFQKHVNGLEHPLHLELRMNRRRPTGEQLMCGATFHRTTSRSGGALIWFRDITDRIARQAELVQEQKMTALGSMVAGLAHDINTPLGSIKANAELAQRLFERLDDVLTTQRTAIGRLESTVSSLRSFARLDEATIKEVDIHECLDSALARVAHACEGRIDLVRNYGDLPTCLCRPHELNQVFLALLTNAIEAIEGRGTITITTEPSGGKLTIAISDDGLGISEPDRERLFDPGFTTKGDGIGGGFGLATAHRIVKGHDGSISAQSGPGRGATFIIVLPTHAGVAG